MQKSSRITDTALEVVWKKRKTLSCINKIYIHTYIYIPQYFPYSKINIDIDVVYNKYNFEYIVVFNIYLSIKSQVQTGM